MLSLAQRLLSKARTFGVGRNVAIRSVQVQMRLCHSAHGRTRAGRKCRSACDDLVARERRAFLSYRPQRAAPPVVDDERPFAAHAMIQVSMRLEETGKFVEHFYREQVRRLHLQRLVHWNCQPPPDFFRQSQQHPACQMQEARPTRLFASFADATFQNASCCSMQASSKCNAGARSLRAQPGMTYSLFSENR